MTFPNPKWQPGTGDQKILKSDFRDLEQAILGQPSVRLWPPLKYVDTATVRVEATADSPASMMFTGFPNIMNHELSITLGLSDTQTRISYANVSMNFGAGNLWGSEKASNYYAVFAIAGDSDTDYTLKAMPYCRVKAEASQVIDLGTHLNAATGIGYGFTTDDFVGSYIYFLTGASKGLARAITANNNDDATGGQITYGGSALTMAQGDWFIILPGMVASVSTNFRWLGDVFNNASSNITEVTDIIYGQNFYFWGTAGTYYWLCPFTWTECYANGCGSGSGGANGSATLGGRGGQSGAEAVNQLINPVAGTIYTVTIPAGGAAEAAGGTTSLGALLSLAGGGAVTGERGVETDGEHGQGGAFGRGGRGGPTIGAGAAPGSGYGGGGGGGGGSGAGFAGAAGRLGCLCLTKSMFNLQ